MDAFDTKADNRGENPIITRQKNKRNKRGYLLFGFFAVICLVIVFLLVKVVLNIRVIQEKTDLNKKQQLELDKLSVEYQNVKTQTTSFEREVLKMQNEFKDANDKVLQIKKDIEELSKKNKELANES